MDSTYELNMAVCLPKHVDVVVDTSLDGGSIPPTSTLCQESWVRVPRREHSQTKTQMGGERIRQVVRSDNCMW